MGNYREIQVFMDNEQMHKATLIGVLYSELLRGKEIFSFEYDTNWLKQKESKVLDPDLMLFSGRQYLDNEKSNFGLFLDSAPDRWGRVLMQRREAILARNEKRAVRKFLETDYLLGVFDPTRMGALRFKLADNDDFLNNNKDLASPPWTSIAKLEQASLNLEKDDSYNDTERIKWLNMLVNPGSSLGGARPKANVLDRNKHLWIAKFPSHHDYKDYGAWEALTAQLAKQCGIDMAETKAQQFSSKYHSFLTKRFDRDKNGKRLHFASAMTMLGYSDGVDAADGVSYLELAEWISQNCVNVAENLKQLWQRIVFSIAVSNCDDHLRNHGFILTPKGWTLSPAYDINPNENGMGLKLNISEKDNSLEYDLVQSVAPYFSIKNEQAKLMITHTKSVVSQWRTLAKQYKIPRSEQELLAGAFRV